MDVNVEEVVALYATIYAHCARRIEPSDYRPSAESVALLEHLSRTGPLTVQEASAHFGRSQAATSEMVKRLIRRDLLATVPDGRDRRRHLVWLTDNGQAVLQAARTPLDPDRVAGSLTRMTDEARQSLLAGMRAFVAGARAVAADVPRRPTTERHHDDD